MKYAFIKAHEMQYRVRRMCSVMRVYPSGYYAWRAQPGSARAQEDARLGALILTSWEESGYVYGYRKINNDLRDLAERCGKHRVARLMRLAKMKSQTGSGRRPLFRSGKPAAVAPTSS